MSEYQWYDFRAVERPLSRDDQQQLRAISTRATITARSFTNFYTFGDFKGDSVDFMRRWFDLHLYFANWGTRIFMVRLPKSAIPKAMLDRFLFGVDEIEIVRADDRIVITVRIEDEGATDTDWMIDAEHRLSEFAPLRDALLRGDHRLLYLCWLMGFAYDAYEDETSEPMEGIGPLTPELSAFAEFFLIDPYLVAVAAERSPVMIPADIDATRASAFLATLTGEEKDAYLRRALNTDPQLAHDLATAALARTDVHSNRPAILPRTVRELRDAADRQRRRQS